MHKIVSVLLTALLCISLLSINTYGISTEFSDYCIPLSHNIGSEQYLVEEGSCDLFEDISLNVILDKKHFKASETISLGFELSSSFTGINTLHSSNGFSVINEIEVSKTENSQIYEVCLTYTGAIQNPSFTLSVNTAEGETLYASIYGFASEWGLFISTDSIDAAMDSCYYYLVDSGHISINEYNQMLQKRYCQYGIETLHDNDISPEFSSVSNATKSTQSQSAPLSTTVASVLGWIDDAYVWHPLQYTRVDICDARLGVTLGTVYSGSNGYYTFSFIDTQTYRDIYIKIYAEGENAVVKTGNGGNYVYTSTTYSNVAPGSNIGISWVIDMTSDLGKAFQVSQAINVATLYVREMNGDYLAPITVKYPHIENKSSSYYSASTDTIYLKHRLALTGCPESYASWDVIMHEYGHHIQSEFGITATPGGNHSFTSNLADLRNSKSIGIRLAWGEAYPSVFGGMAQDYYSALLPNIATVGDAKYQSYNGAFLDYETPSRQIGEACEASVIGVLWDLFDTSIEAHDTISISHEDYWDLITQSNATTLSEFCEYFYTCYPTNNDFDLGKLLSFFKMSVSSLSCSNTEDGLPSFTWVANGTSNTLPNNQFDLIIFAEDQTVVLRVDDLSSTSYSLSADEWTRVLNGYGNTYTVVIIAYQISTPITGNYMSAPLSVTKPTHN